MTTPGPLRGPGNGGGYAGAVLAAPAKGTGPPPRPIRVLGDGPAGRLAPGDPCGPSDQEKRAGPSLPRPAAGASRTARAGHDHHNRMLHGLRGTPTRQSRLPARLSNVYQRSSS